MAENNRDKATEANAPGYVAGEMEGHDTANQPGIVNLASRAIMDDVRNVAGRVEPHTRTSPYRTTGFVPGQVESKDVNVGVNIDDELGFPVHSIIIDNPTSQWIWLESAARSIPPGNMDRVVQVPRASTKAQIRWRAPAGVAQPGAGAAVAATITFCEAFLQPSPGLYISVYPPPAIA